MRKEFVDDLLSLGETLSQFRLQDSGRSLENLPVDAAEEIIHKAASQGELSLAAAPVRVAADLARDGRVRPVELQIVLARMQEQGVLDISAYEVRGGAQRIVTRFVAETIEPPPRSARDRPAGGTAPAAQPLRGEFRRPRAHQPDRRRSRRSDRPANRRGC